jgi:putative acetyltransferase
MDRACLSVGDRAVMASGDETKDIKVTIENPHSPAARLLIERLSADLGARYGDDGSGSFSPDDILVPGAAFVIARLAGEAVGCGALRPLREAIGEIKRMYVEPRARGCGIARMILRELETIAEAAGYNAVWLETGTLQPEAIRLYETAGYKRIARYGQYVDNPLSVCFEKQFDKKI